jgi:hypothetical protein
MLVLTYLVVALTLYPIRKFIVLNICGTNNERMATY